MLWTKSICTAIETFVSDWGDVDGNGHLRDFVHFTIESM